MTKNRRARTENRRYIIEVQQCTPHIVNIVRYVYALTKSEFHRVVIFTSSKVSDVHIAVMFTETSLMPVWTEKTAIYFE